METALMNELGNLTELNGVSGNEHIIRIALQERASGYADSIKVDSMGNLIVFRRGRSSDRRIMLSAHMDEVGFIITGYGEKGRLNFKTVGGIDSRILSGKRVLIGDRCIPGIIGCKPIHLQEKEENDSIVKLKSMYIDIGTDSVEASEKLVSRGDYAAFDSRFCEMGDKCIKAKALDDRAGCAILLEVIKNRCVYPFDLHICFTVQEETGLRGAEVVANVLNPDIAVVVEGTTCSDVPGVEKYEYSTLLGQGPAISLMDRTTYYDRDLVDFIYNTAQKNNIRTQFKQTITGGNESGAIQRSGKGAKVAAISLPCRYIHSPVSIMHKTDYCELRQLLDCVLMDMKS